MNLGNWQIDTISGGTFRLDGGVVFGVVPRTLWQGVVRPDDKNRIALANRCVLARDGAQTVLIDTGYGGKYSPLDRRFYDLEDGEPLLRSLAAVGVDPAEIDTVVFTHLHFDHVGGASRAAAGGRVIDTFPRARYVAGRVEWHDATGGRPELATAYQPGNLQPLEQSGRLQLIDDDTEVVPGLRAQITGGHTRGHMSLQFESGGETACVIGDICPSTVHLRQMWCLAYDLYPVETRSRKPQLLGDAADQRWWIIWSHDPKVAMCRVLRDARREFVPDASATLGDVGVGATAVAAARQ